jgi:hypothetical protein
MRLEPCDVLPIELEAVLAANALLNQPGCDAVEFGHELVIQPSIR